MTHKICKQISDISSKLSHLRTSTDENVLAMPSKYCNAGKYNVTEDEYDEFLKWVSEDVINEIPIHYLEKPHPKYNQVKIDLDMRFTPTNEELASNKVIKKRYTYDFIEKFVVLLIKNINKLIQDKEYYVYVQEKQYSTMKDKMVKEGIHIMIPDIVMHNNVLHLLRNNIINDKETQSLFDTIENKNSINETIDKCIIDKNAWFIYGNGKNVDFVQDEPNFYETTHIYINKKDGSPKKLKQKKINELHSDYLKAIKRFSNFDKKVNVKYKNDVDKKADVSSSTIYDYNNSVPPDIPHSKKKNETSLTQTEIEGLLSCINKERADAFESWWRIGLSLYNMDTRNFIIWNDWSRTSDKYDANQVKQIWKSFEKISSRYGLGLHTIKNYAEEDNPTKYNKFTQLEKNKFIKSWLISIMNKEDYMQGKSFDIINLVNNIIKYINDYADFNIVCAHPEGTKQLWYKFTEHRWVEDKGASSIYLLLRNVLMTDLKKYKVHSRNEINKIKLTMRLTTTEDEDMNTEQQISQFRDLQNNIHTEESLIGILDKLLNFMQSITNKKKIIEDMSYQCFDSKFYEQLDLNKDVFVCNNGVIDLKHCIFRKGEMSDMVTYYSDIEYPININDFDAMDIYSEIDEFLEKIFVDDEIRVYVIYSIAEKLSGHNNREEFFIYTGSGSNGKSQFFKLVKEAFGMYYDTFDNALLNTQKSDANNASAARAGLRGPRIEATSEPKANKPIETDLLKEYIGGDPLTARVPFDKKNITFEPQYKMFMMCNDIPEMPATDDGVWRKVRVVPCESKFVTKKEDMYKLNEPDKYPNHFKADGKLGVETYKKWAPYFIKILFDKYKYLKSLGFNYNIPEKVLEATKTYKSTSNVYESYYNDRIHWVPGHETSEVDAFADFRHYVTQNNLGQTVSRKFFTTQIEKFIGKSNSSKKFINYKFGPYSESNNDK